MLEAWRLDGMLCEGVGAWGWADLLFWTVMEYSLEIEGIFRTARGGDCLGDSREVEYEKGREGRRRWGAENSHHLSASRSR